MTATIDRKLGTKHPKHDYTCPINYGFVPNTIAPDDAELDIYVLGADNPIDTFQGVRIAIIHRLNDDDDKLIVCKDGETYTDDEIRKQTDFQEQWFTSETLRP